MKKTFALLTQFQISELKQMKTQMEQTGEVHLSPQMDKLLKQMDEDFRTYISQGSYAINARAENHLKAVAALKKDDPYCNEQTMIKIDLLNDLFGAYNNVQDEEKTTKVHEGAQILFDMYSALDTVLALRKSSETQKTVSSYKTHLQQMLEKEGIAPRPGATIISQLSSKQQKLLYRYQAIENIHEQIRGKDLLTDDDFKDVKNAVKTCMENQPQASEKTFLEKLAHLLKVAFKLRYQTFFSKEEILIDDVKKNLPDSTPRL